MSRIPVANQLEFNSLLLDTLFGLMLFFSVDSFLEIKYVNHFVFYILSTIILIHWWLIFKSAFDCFDIEISESAIYMIFSLTSLIFLEYFTLMTAGFKYITATWFLVAVALASLLWAITWKYIGHWRTKNPTKVNRMEKELESHIKLDIIISALYMNLALFGHSLSPNFFLALFIGFYIFVIYLSFKFRIIDIDAF